MIERERFPNKFKQVVNFLKGHREIKKDKDTYEAGFVQKGILYGLNTLIPKTVRRSGILNDSARREMVDKLLIYQVRLNDRLDFERSRRTDMSDIVTEATEKEAEAKEQLEESLIGFDEGLKQIIFNMLEEVEIVENHAARRAGMMTFDEVEQYRNIVNAISNCLLTVTILGTNSLNGRLTTLSEED
jgi:hypothetical protein